MAKNTFFKTLRNSIKHWYVPLILGILLIILGFYVLSTPLESYLTLSLIFSWTFLISGILDIVFAVSNKDSIEGWGWSLFGGIIYALFGIYLLANPMVSIATLPFVIGFIAMFRAFQYLAFSFDLKSYGVKGWGWSLFFAILGILFSFVLIWNPVVAGLTLVYYTSFAIVFTGITACIVAFQLKSLKDKGGKISEEWKNKYEALKEEYHKF